MPGGGKDENTILWNPVAHSVLNTTTNELTGGLIPEHRSISLMMIEMTMISWKSKYYIAVHKDLMDGEASGSTITFRPARYQLAVVMLTITVRVRVPAIRSNSLVSLPGGNTYPSSAFDRLVYSYRNPTQDCGGDATDVGLGQIEGIWVCEIIQIPGIHLHQAFTVGYSNGCRGCSLP